MLVFLAVNVSLLAYRHAHGEGEDAPFRVPLNVGWVPVPTVLALVGVLALLGFNLVNLWGG